MQILLTGNTKYFFKEWVDYNFPGDIITIAGNPGFKTDRSNQIASFPNCTNASAIATLFDAYDFDCVIYFSNLLTYAGDPGNELEILMSVLHRCRMAETPKFIYITHDPGFRGEDGPGDFIKIAAGMFAQYQSPGFEAQIVYAPCLYSIYNQEDFIYHLMKELDSHGKFTFDSSETQRISFMCLDDLGELVRSLLNYWQPDLRELVVPDKFGLTFPDIANVLKRINPGWKFKYNRDAEERDAPQESETLRKRYGWFPRISILEDIPAMWGAYLNIRPEKEGFFDRIRRWFSGHQVLAAGTELIVSAALAWLCIRFSENQVQFRMIDFRLLYVVIMGTVYGMNMGIAAAAVASAALIYANYSEGVKPLTLFYEPTNWLPFIAYFTVGALSGFVRIREQDKQRFLMDENRLIRDKFSFVRQLYLKVLNEKRYLKKQIVGSKDSFGKIFKVTRQLEVHQREEVFIQALTVLENLLDNNSIALYTIAPGNQYFGRLRAASRNILSDTPHSIRLEDYQKAIDVIREGEVFSNTELLEGYPAFMAGITNHDELRMLIMIRDSAFEQMSLYYVNLINILCGLISSSMLRALEYEEAHQIEEKIEGTNLYTPHAFLEKLALEQEMSERHIARYELLRCSRGSRPLEMIDSIAAKSLRSDDIAGLGLDNDLYIILHQAASEAIPAILQRLERNGLKCKVVSPTELLASQTAATGNGEQADL